MPRSTRTFSDQRQLFTPLDVLEAYEPEASGEEEGQEFRLQPARRWWSAPRLILLTVVGVVVIVAVLWQPDRAASFLRKNLSRMRSSDLAQKAAEGSQGSSKASRPEHDCKDCDPCTNQVECVQIVDSFFEKAKRGRLGLFQTYQEPLNGGECVQCDLSDDFRSLQKRCDVYDNAVAAIYLTKRGSYNSARRILDVFVQLLYPTDFSNNYPEELFTGSSGFSLRLLAASYDCDMEPKAESFASPSVIDGATDSGNNAWVAIALAHFAATTGEGCYGLAANDILQAITSTGACRDELDGFSARLPPTRGHQRATEHNIDIFALAGMLQQWDLQDRASRFVQKMHGRHEAFPDAYALGTGAAHRCDSSRTGYDAVPADAQFWNFLAEVDPNAGRVGKAMSWAIYSDYLWDTDEDKLSGRVPPPQLHGARFTSKGFGIQWEETAGAAMALAHFLHRHSKGSSEEFLQQLKYRLNASRLSIRTLLKSYRAVPASVRGGNGEKFNKWHDGYAAYPGGSDTGMGFSYLRMIHCASTAWAGLLMLYQTDNQDRVWESANPLAVLEGTEVPSGDYTCLPQQASPPAAVSSKKCMLAQ